MGLPYGASVSIDGARLLDRLAELAQIGAIEGTQGCSRLAFSDADREGRDLVVTWMRDLGLTVTVDTVGNVVASTGGDGATGAVMAGSHIDTVGTGGRYDAKISQHDLHETYLEQYRIAFVEGNATGAMCSYTHSCQ